MSDIDPCPSCQGKRFVCAFKVDSSRIMQCAGCGLGTTQPLPHEADGRESFAEHVKYFEEAYAGAKDRWWHRFMDAPLDALDVVGTPPGRKLLDVGCSLGYLVAKAAERGYDARGVDGSHAAIEVGRKRLGLNLLCARIETAPIEPTSLDIVVVNHVLEHLADPLASLQRMKNWLKPNGLLIIGLPNFGSPIARFSQVHWAGLVPTQHIWHFTPTALRQLVEKAGFEPLWWTTRMLTYRPKGLLGWGKWASRWVLEKMHLADNLILVARPVVSGVPR